MLTLIIVHKHKPKNSKPSFMEQHWFINLNISKKKIQNL